eukprot:TRINITY_DN12358_c0_g1_i1.p1 TRINITY_DN12358_c0_g1~~TRINITY_DN12358_c0_g1_i1.p1  ORF type:complete len:532 (+),score=129.11 TRINITY_DN12358_c0_g1_i1:53-1648(+)
MFEAGSRWLPPPDNVGRRSSGSGASVATDRSSPPPPPRDAPPRPAAPGRRRGSGAAQPVPAAAPRPLSGSCSHLSSSVMSVTSLGKILLEAPLASPLVAQDTCLPPPHPQPLPSPQPSARSTPTASDKRPSESRRVSAATSQKMSENSEVLTLMERCLREKETTIALLRERDKEQRLSLSLLRRTPSPARNGAHEPAAPARCQDCAQLMAELNSQRRSVTSAETVIDGLRRRLAAAEADCARRRSSEVRVAADASRRRSQVCTRDAEAQTELRRVSAGSQTARPRLQDQGVQTRDGYDSDGGDFFDECATVSPRSPAMAQARKGCIDFAATARVEFEKQLQELRTEVQRIGAEAAGRSDELAAARAAGTRDAAELQSMRSARASTSKELQWLRTELESSQGSCSAASRALQTAAAERDAALEQAADLRREISSSRRPPTAAAGFLADTRQALLEGIQSSYLDVSSAVRSAAGLRKAASRVRCDCGAKDAAAVGGEAAELLENMRAARTALVRVIGNCTTEEERQRCGFDTL